MKHRLILCCLIVCLPFSASIAAQDAGTASPATEVAPDLMQQAEEAFRDGNFEVAIQKYQAILARDPKSDKAQAGLARVYLKQEKVQQALESVNRALAQAPESVASHVVLGEILFRQGRMAEAEKEFLKGVNTDHRDARAYLGLVSLYDAYSLHASAQKFLEIAHALDPEDPAIQHRWMATLHRAEKIKWLQARLAAGGYDDDDTREDMRTHLEYLRVRENQPDLQCRLATRLRSTETDLRPLLLDPTHVYGFGLNVKINGQSSRLLLDTGAGGIFINQRLAQKAGIKPLVKSHAAGIGDQGDTASYLGYAKSIKIGELEFENCIVEVSEKRSIIGDDGLIGADVFSDYLITIDFLWQKLKLQELPRRPGDPEGEATLVSRDTADDEGASRHAPQDRYVSPDMQAYTKVFRFGHELLIPTRVSDASPKLFLIDTGAMFTSISPEAAREVTKVHHDDYTTIRGISGTVKEVYVADKMVLQFSRYRQENEEMTAFDTSRISRNAGAEVSGILGFATLRQFTLKIDYRDGLVDFVYNGGKR